MSAPGDTYEALICDLLSLYPAEDERYLFRESHIRVGHLAHGWLMRCLRTTEAALLLGRQGYDFEAAPLRRSVVEHMTGLAWLAAEGSPAADSVIRLNANHAERRLSAVQEAGWTGVREATFHEVIADGEDTQRAAIELDVAWAFINRNKQYGSPDYVPAWETETGHCHPSWTSASPYMEADDDGRVGLLDAPVPPPFDMYEVAVPPTVDALVAFNMMLEGHPLTDRLRMFIQRFRDLHAGALAARGLPRPTEFDLPILPDLP